MVVKEEAVVVLAANWAARAHNGHYRKDGVTPYFAHVARASALGAKYGLSVVARAALLFHDVEEDHPDFDLSEFNAELMVVLEEVYGKDLGTKMYKKFHNIRKALTKAHSLPEAAGMKSAERRRYKDIENYGRILKADPEAVACKFCDRIDNMLDSAGVDDDFMHLYIEETELLISMLMEKAYEYGYVTPVLDLQEAVKETKKRLGIPMPFDGDTE